MSAIKCFFTGRLGQDAHFQSLPNGRQILSFPVATTKRWISAEGIRRTKTIWVRCSMFGPRIAPLATQLTRGTTIFVLDGELTVRRKDTDDGSKEQWGVVVHELSLGARGLNRPSEPESAERGS